MLLESLQAIESIIIANIRLLCSTNRLCNLYLIYLKDKYRYIYHFANLIQCTFEFTQLLKPSFFVQLGAKNCAYQ